MPKLAAELTREIEEPGSLGQLLRSEIGHGNLGERHEDEPQSGAAEDHRQHGIPHADVSVK